MHEMHLAQSVFSELERLAAGNALKKVGVVHLRMLQADSDCFVESLEMLFSGKPLWQDAEIRIAESPQAPTRHDDARVVIDRIEGEKE